MNKTQRKALAPDPDWYGVASQLWKQGFTSFEIGDKVGVDRMAIIRLSLKRRDLFPHRSKAYLSLLGQQNAKKRLAR